MSELTRAHMPLIEVFGDEIVVTSNVPCWMELLLLIAKSEPNGMDRRAVGISSKFPSSTVARTLQKLEDDRYIHKMKAGSFHITGPRHLVGQLAAAGH